MQTNGQRHLDLEGGYNIRDLGGYDTVDGGQTNWRVFLRAASLDKLTPEAQQSLVDFGLQTIVDLRQPNELAEQPSVFATSTSSPTYVHIDVLVEGTTRPTPPEDLPSELRTAESYKYWIDERQAGLLQTLKVLSAPGALPGLYNCAAGKDRTGLISALLLGLAGVPNETIVADYALSAHYLWPRDRDEFRRAHGSEATLEEFSRAYSAEQTMEIVLEYMQTKYGGIPEYVQEIGLDEEDMAYLRSSLLD
jgi:protein-tyrosine phosphatase